MGLGHLALSWGLLPSSRSPRGVSHLLVAGSTSTARSKQTLPVSSGASPSPRLLLLSFGAGCFGSFPTPLPSLCRLLTSLGLRLLPPFTSVPHWGVILQGGKAPSPWVFISGASLQLWKLPSPKERSWCKQSWNPGSSLPRSPCWSPLGV